MVFGLILLQWKCYGMYLTIKSKLTDKMFRWTNTLIQSQCICILLRLKYVEVQFYREPFLHSEINTHSLWFSRIGRESSKEILHDYWTNTNGLFSARNDQKTFCYFYVWGFKKIIITGIIGNLFVNVRKY